ncbi:uncharacterized protein [Rutidosis leptorrhynchoides]|uniref:uncharacterized protein n=1 Tax=Rutidosis leptorrhynchoides TaxID=125765 RepID=UPI003A99029B
MNIFQSHDLNRPSLRDIQYPRITEEEAAVLEQPITEQEIIDAINECGSTKAPGPDGFNLGFFKKFWPTIKESVIDAVSGFWANGEFSRGCNASFVTLVLKKLDPLHFGEFRPISLINSYYKIIAKLLSIRLRKIIHKLIGGEQSAFLKGRYILDGALIANEVVDYLHHKRQKGVIFKVDFEKAFDSLSWDFLMEVMESMGFGLRWRNWIRSCLKSASISILINGSPTREFNLGRGVRQGDPLSPFLFILAAEGLNLLTKVAVQKCKFKGLEIGSDKVMVSHLQYADDTIFIGEWDENNVNNLILLLKCFELTSGLKINYHKSQLFGIGVPNNEVVALSSKFNCQEGIDIDNSGIQFSNSFVKKVNNGCNTCFWDDHWLGNYKLKDKFARLYRLESVKDVLIMDRFEQSASGFNWNWEWLQNPRGRTAGELSDLQNLLSSVSFNRDKQDTWTWNLSSKGFLTVKKLTSIIEEHILAEHAVSSSQDTLRNNLLPKKIEIFIWRAIQRKLPVRVELDKRGIDLHTVRCPLCDDGIESVDHSLVLCNQVWDIWDRVYKWWNLGNVSNLSINELFRGNTMLQLTPFGKKLWQAVEWSCGYLLWKNRNGMVFKKKSWTPPVALNEIQIKSFEWISHRINDKRLDWLTWLSNPQSFAT